MPSYPLSSKLVRILGHAANYFSQVEPSGNVPGVVKFSSKAQLHMIFMSMISHDLKGMSGR
jgi:hypothetical protein